ncbi:MAG: type II toxin-antitoxin system VapC family toxin [Actinomycetota bacterium]
MTPVLIDTGAWIAVIEPSDRFHRASAAHLEELIRRRVPLVTTNYIVSETATRLRYDSGLATALRFRGQLERSVATGRLRVAWVDEGSQKEAWAVLERYADVALSMTDAVSAAVARSNKITTVFGFDSDFRAIGFDLQPTM